MYELRTVTRRIRSIKQPRGGYIPAKSFIKSKKDDGMILNENENIHASIVGMVIDYLSRFNRDGDKRSAFSISLSGARRAKRILNEPCDEEAESYLEKITGDDDVSIINACKIVTFDVWKRNEFEAQNSKRACDTNPDSETIKNIQIMLKRCSDFWDEYGPIVYDGFTFLGGYTPTVFTGDGDYMTDDTLWELKVSKSPPTSKHTLQVLMYWIMGMHSNDNSHFKKIKKLGIYNPRLNIVYQYDLINLSDEVIKEVEDNVICYKDYADEEKQLFPINTKSIVDIR